MTTILIDGCAPSPAVARNTIYVPFVTTGINRTAVCFDSPAAYAFYELLTTDERQQHASLTCCPALVTAAKWRAVGLASVDPWGHVDAAGRWPNQYARMAGCHLPDDYPEQGNYIESLAAGSPDAQAIFDALANSPKHSDHLFGRGDFFARQRQIGIAVAAGGQFGWYWVIMIGICESSDDQ